MDESLLPLKLMDYFADHVSNDADMTATLALAREIIGSALYLELTRNHKKKFLDKYIELSETLDKKSEPIKATKPSAIVRIKEKEVD